MDYYIGILIQSLVSFCFLRPLIVVIIYND